ncbi:hypothetical protein TNCV_79781 [Trichonephila clavipes]|nr:hypothetical protein TNCV_79781 [Trichonephila clavipes]
MLSLPEIPLLVRLYYQKEEFLTATLRSYHEEKNVKDLLRISFVTSLPRLSDLMREAKRQYPTAISLLTYIYAVQCCSTDIVDEGWPTC